MCWFPERRRMKARAPPPPNQSPASCKVNNEQKVTTDVGMLPDQGGINMKENMINRTVDFTVVFPDGEEQKNTVHGSKAVMDLLVDLCSRYHLNPAHHTLELHSGRTPQPLQYKPNTLIGALDVQKILLKEKTPEGKTKRPPPPKIPEKTVRLVVNYLKTQKAVVRVNPEVPLGSIIPTICEKCEVSQEHLILLRDDITGEELELTKSLNELGIKELYAWDRKRETRNSTSCDPVEKEKKRFLGFFRTNKRSSKGEESSVKMDMDYASEEPLKSTAASQQSLDRITTAPNSPSVNSCSVTLGPSWSLGNISGVTASSEIKKRRAPPPPTAVPQSGETNGQEKSQMSQSSSLNDLQKKKRRAPLPPAPPSSPVPTRPNGTEEMEDKRQSTVGDGRQVPQKPPRGNTRGPPQLVIPPPPPYPPSDSDMDPTVLYNGTDGTDPTELVPKRDEQISSGNNYGTDDIGLELSETEETTSVSSCFASEDTTEDSGVMSSPSDIVSLDSQNDSLRSRDKSDNAQDTLAGTETTVVAETCLLKNGSFNSDESGNFHRSMEEDEMMEAKCENSETFIAARLEQTLAAFDKELEAMEGTHEDSKSESIPSEMDGPLLQNVKAAEDIPAAVPVTIIDEVPEADIAIHYAREGEDASPSQAQANQDVPVNLISPGKPSNENNNAGSFSKGHVNSGSPYLFKGLLRKQSLDPEFRHQNKEVQKHESETQTSSWEKKNKDKANLEVASKNAANIKLISQVNGTKEKVKSLNEQSVKEDLPSKTKMELESRPASGRSTEATEAAPPPSLWSSRVHNVIASYEPKMGLTTFKVVPPKPEVKRFARDVSLSTGAIKIDELGNLVTPNIGGIKKVAVHTPSSETGETLIGRAKAYWRSNSTEKPLEESPVGCSNKSPVIPVSKPLSKASETKQDCLTSQKVAAVPLIGSKVAENNLGPEKTKPLLPVIQCPVKTTLLVGNKDKVELLFQKPQRRTSSHYVASAIAKSLDPTLFRTNRERHDKEEESSAQRGAKAEVESLPKRCIIVAKSCSVEPQPARPNEGYSGIFSCSNNIANKLPSGAQSKMTNNTANMKSLNQTSPTSSYRRSFSAPFTTASSQDGIMEKETSCDSTQNVIVRETSSVFTQNGEQAGQNSSFSFCRPFNAPTSSVASSSLVKSSSEHTVQNGSLEFNGAPLLSHVASEKGENLGSASTRNELEPNIRDDSNVYSVFGPKKKFKPVVQKPLPRDTSLHSALMEAIQTAGGREKLRKISDSAVNGTQKKALVSEPENERSALLAAIRGHSGASKLRKTSSSASEELQSFRNAELGSQIREASPTEQPRNPPLLSLPPPPPPPPAHLSTKTPRTLARTNTENPRDSRQALMEAIRSGTGAARLRKVPLLV